ncbi:MAG TPA: PadR family transcriptional regulator [Allosphingosinicella sp.]|jgi:DNA-binding PadR family transcriptional regulator
MRVRFGHGCGGRGFDIPAAILAAGMGRGGWGRGWGQDEWGAEAGGWGRDSRRRRRFDAGELRLVLLKLIADEPRHGYDLIRAIEELTHGSYAPSPGVIYPTLTMLQDMGLIEEAASEGARKAFAATADGRAHLAERAEELARLMARLTGMGEDRRKAGGGPAGRAVRNLLAALWNRVTEEGADEERLHEIAAILDDAAQRIERLK